MDHQAESPCSNAVCSHNSGREFVWTPFFSFHLVGPQSSVKSYLWVFFAILKTALTATVANPFLIGFVLPRKQPLRQQ